MVEVFELLRVIYRKLPILAYATCIWHLYWEQPVNEYFQDLRHQKTKVTGLSCGTICASLHLTVSVEHRLVTDRHVTTVYTALAWRHAVKVNHCN